MYERATFYMNGQFRLGDVSPIRYFLAIGVSLGILFFLITPGEDDNVNGAILAIQWQLQTLLPILSILLVSSCLPSITKFNALPSWLQLVVCGTFGALLFVPLGLVIDMVLLGEEPENKLLQNLLDESLAVVPAITAGWMFINAPFILGFTLQKEQFDSRGTLADKKLETIPFIRLLPEEIREVPIYIKSELHYLEVVTPSGKALVLYNLKDAIAELGNTTGIQTHRSYWVNKNYISNLEKQGRQGMLILSTGHKVPISRNKMAEFKDSMA